MRFYPGLTPETFWALRWDEYQALREHLEQGG